MKITNKSLLTVFGAAALALTCSIASAGSAYWTITYGTPQSVPTLSEWGMITLSVALAVFAAYYLRKNGAGKPLASIVLLGGLVLSGVVGNSVIRNAEAVPSVSGEMIPSDGGTVTISSSGNGIDVPVTNNTGVPQIIKSVIPVSGPTGNGHTTCIVGLSVSAGSVCYVNSGPT